MAFAKFQRHPEAFGGKKKQKKFLQVGFTGGPLTILFV